MKRSLWMGVGLSFLVACTPSGSSSRPPVGGEDDREAEGASGGPAKVDVVVAFTAGYVAADGFASGLADVLNRIAAARARVDLRVAVIGSRALLVDALPVLAAALGAERLRAIDLALQPNELRPVAVAAACHADASDFRDSHQGMAVPPRICGHDFSALTGKPKTEVDHHWLWTIQPVRGVLHDFLRAGVHRRFVFVSRTDDALDLFTDGAFAKAVEAAPRPASFDVAAILPTTAIPPAAGTDPASLCATEIDRRHGVSPSVTLAGLARTTSGVLRDYCTPRWTGHAEAIGKQIERKVGR